jgi:hypothetical protein
MQRNLFTLSIIFSLFFGVNGTEIQAASKPFEGVHKCDEYAAHPDDPGKWASGVSEDELIPGPAVKFCTDAVKKYPDTPRFHFQLGRALIKANQTTKAFNSLKVAAEEDNGPAFAYLADFYRFGVIVKKDFKTAERYYDLASKFGFTPAEEEKQAMLGNSSHNEDSQVSSACNDPYAKARACDKQFRIDGFTSMASILKDLHDGEFDSVKNESQWDVTFYLTKIQASLEEKYNMQDEACSSYADPRVSQALYHKHMAARGMNTKSGNLAQTGQVALTQTLKMLAGAMKDGGAGFMNNVMEVDLIERSANKDAVGLTKYYGCESPVFKRLYDNISAYAFDRQPKHMSGFTAFKYSCGADAQQRGSKAQQATQVCSCFQEKFKGANVSISDAEWLAKNYDQGKNFAKVIKKYSGLADAIKRCLI